MAKLNQIVDVGVLCISQRITLGQKMSTHLLLVSLTNFEKTSWIGAVWLLWSAQAYHH